MLRLFLAARLSEESLQYSMELEKILRRKMRGRFRVRWTQMQGRHITLAFLGQVDSGLVAGIQQAMLNLAEKYSPCLVSVGGLGAFPRAERGRALWLGIVDPFGCLQSLAADVQKTLITLGLSLDERAYHPHVTLARMHDRAGADLTDIVQMDTGTVREMRIDHFELLQTELRASGARYQPLAKFTLSQ